jgi:5-methylcytosine-specific restriction protein A
MSANNSSERLRRRLTPALGIMKEMGMLTILWHDVESAGYTDQIPINWLSHEDGLEEVTHTVSGPRSGQHKAKCDVKVRDNVMELDYEPYEKFNSAHDMFLGVMRVQFANQYRERVTQVFWKEKGHTKFAPCSTTASVIADDPHDFEALVAASKRLSAAKRRARLASALKKPARTQVVSTAFQRNPDVVAAVLIRAKGQCEDCKRPAPFKRASDDTPYLEVHHRVHLAQGGDDTVENAVALCPNCHREAHYG